MDLIELAAVRWSNPSDFSLDCVTLAPTERDRLRYTLGALERAAAQDGQAR